MEFVLDVILYLIGSGIVALCLVAIPGPPAGGEGAPPPGGHHHGGH